MIHNEIMKHVKARLEEAVVELSPFDLAKATLVQNGPLQGEPDPDEARVYLEIYMNDPDAFIGGALTSFNRPWNDEIYEVEIGGNITHRRRFTVKGRCLLDVTRENLDDAQEIASTLRGRIEEALQNMSFAGVSYGTEYVSLGCQDVHGEMIQAGGPPDSYDFHVKVRFEVLTSKPYQVR